MQPSSYHYPGAYDDLRLPPIRNSDSHSSSARPHTSSRYVAPLEPPTHTSSSVYPPRSAGVNLPPLRQTERRPSTSQGHSYHPQVSLPLPHAPRHASHHHQSHSNQILPHSGPHQSSSSSHHRPSSLSVNTSGHYAYTHASPSTHRNERHGDYDATSPTSASRSFTCDLCGATFSRAYDCKRHREIHTRQGGHICPFCNKALSRADALKRHMERGCTGMEEDDPGEIDRDHDRKDRKDKRHNASGEGGSSKYYYTSVSSRHH